MSQPAPLAFARHDHSACTRTAMDTVAETCRARGLRLTPVRARVMEILLESHKALGAYDILDRLRDEGLGAQPPVAYRALGFLEQHGFAHRIERLNAYIACCHTDRRCNPAFLICTGCGRVAELDAPAADGQFLSATREIGFQVSRTVVEAEGLCPACRTEGETAS